MIDVKRVGKGLRACCNRSWPHTMLCRICDAKEGGESELKSHYDTKHNTMEMPPPEPVLAEATDKG